MSDVCAQMLNRGDQIGSYTVRRRLGAGGMGEVYLADHRHIDRRAAIKVLLPEFSTNEGVVARFFTEARAASRIKHPGIVEIVDCEIDPRGRAYIVMELLDGESLGASLERVGCFDLHSALAISGQIASALAAAHSKGIIHRDLKPDNVFLKATPEAEAAISVKILDFGIAKLVAGGVGEKGKTKTGSLLGTPLYMAPEQCRGAGSVDHRADIYSLGCIAFEMITGRPPFVRDGAGELIAAHLSEPPTEILSLEPSLPPDLGRLVMRTLAKNPGDRPQSMIEIVHEVEVLLGAPAAQFLKLIQVPEGFPSGHEASQEVVSPAEQVQSGVPVEIDAFAGGTRALPQAPPKTTTLAHTASELTKPPNPASRSHRAIWIIAVPAAALLVGIGIFAARRSAPSASRPAPPPADEAFRPARVTSPQPPSPPPSPPPPAPVTDVAAGDGSGDAAKIPPEKIRRGKAPSQLPPHKRKATRPPKTKDFTFIPE